MGLLSRVKRDKSSSSAPAPAPVARQSLPWDSSRFRVQLKMAKSRIDIQRSKKDNEMDAQRRKIAEHLRQKKEPLARILGDRVLRERTNLIAFDILETCIEVLVSSNNNLVSNNDLSKAPGDVQESICSVVYAAPRVNVPELIAVTDMLRSHYGAQVIDPVSRMEGPFVNRVNEILAVQLAGNPTDGYLILQELEQIAREHQLQWRPPPEESDLNNFHAFQRDHNFGSGGDDFGDAGGGSGVPGSYLPTKIPGAPVGFPGAPVGFPGAPPPPHASAPPPDMPHFPQDTPNQPEHHPYAPPPDSGGFNDDDALQARFNDIINAHPGF